MTYRKLGLLLVLAALAVTVIGTASAAKTAKGGVNYPTVQNIGPRYTTSGGASVLPTTKTVQHWHGSLVDGQNGQTYGFNMVGADPASGAAADVKTEIIPVDFVFAADNGFEFPGAGAAAAAQQSPVYTPAAMPSGETAQYLDAVMRAEFDKIGSGYHTTLTNTAVLPTQTIVVPQNQGAVYQVTDGALVGLASYSWFEAQLQQILNNAKADPTTLPVVISNDVYLYEGSLDNCCVIGFHGASKVPGNGGGAVHGNGNQAVQTYAYASYIPDAGIFGPGMTDVAALSHEIAEWGHDPFVDNLLSPWSVPDEPQYGCSPVLETGDPLVGTDFAAGNTNTDPNTGPAWHLQDEAYLWWFAHETSQASNGQYSYLGTFTSPAPGCPAG